MARLSGASPIHVQRGRVGVLMLHRFTGTPAAWEPWSEALTDLGYSVSAPLLPGHGTTPQECNETRWADWYAAAEESLVSLRSGCDQVYVVGHGMGGALALALAQEQPRQVDGLVLVNPEIGSRRWTHRVLRPSALRVLDTYPAHPDDVRESRVREVAYDRVPAQALRSLIRSWTAVRAGLPLVRQPLLVFQSINDHLVDGTSLELLRRGVSSNDVSYVQLWQSYHVAMLDVESDAMLTATRKFIDRVAADVRGD